MKRIKAKEDLFRKLQELDEQRVDIGVMQGDDNQDGYDLRNSFLEPETQSPGKQQAYVDLMSDRADSDANMTINGGPGMDDSHGGRTD